MRDASRFLSKRVKVESAVLSPHDFIRISLVSHYPEADTTNTLTVTCDKQAISVLLSGENAPDERVAVIPHSAHSIGL
jgi:hypothetical protein